MGLKIMRDRNGNPRTTWWGRYCVKGKYHDVDLRVPIRGTMPTNGAGRVTLTAQGDDAFEKSRKAAQRELERVVKLKTQTAADLEVTVYKARTGVDIAGVPLAKLAELWKAQKRGYAPTDGWCQAVAGWFDDFTKFAGKYAAAHGVRCETINDITPEIAGAWFDDLKKSFAWETVTKKMSLMRGAFRRYATNGHTNPFEDVVIRNRETANARVNHKPLTAEQTERLFECARDDESIYPLIVTAACTGMRIGDVCNLKWADVDLRGGFIDCVTAKAGVRATIPIFGRLRDVLSARAAIPGDGRKPSAFVFPAAADRYARNPDGIYQAGKPYFAQAVFGGEPETAMIETDAQPRALADVIDAAGFTKGKREKILEVYARFKAGTPSHEIAAALGMARSQVSMYLHDAERLTGEKLRPRAQATQNRTTRIALIEKTRGKVENDGKIAGRIRKASLYGWHSLRATFVVLAAEAGVPLADIARVVGHTTTEMTMQYFNPDKRHAAERVRAQMAGTVLDGTTNGRKRIGARTAVATANPTVDDIIARMNKKQKQAFMAKLLESM